MNSHGPPPSWLLMGLLAKVSDVPGHRTLSAPNIVVKAACNQEGGHHDVLS
jgi:hypothetical protein